MPFRKFLSHLVPVFFELPRVPKRRFLIICQLPVNGLVGFVVIGEVRVEFPFVVVSADARVAIAEMEQIPEFEGFIGPSATLSKSRIKGPNCGSLSGPAVKPI